MKIVFTASYSVRILMNTSIHAISLEEKDYNQSDERPRNTRFKLQRTLRGELKTIQGRSTSDTINVLNTL